MTGDRPSRPADEAPLDQAIRRTVLAIASTAPEPPPLPVAETAPPESSRRLRRRVPPRLLAAAAVVVVLSAGVGAWAVGDRRPSVDHGPAVDASGQVMRHQVLEVTIDAELVCDGATDVGRHTIRVDSWIDDPGERFRQQVTDDRGTVVDYVNEGPTPYPVRAYRRGDLDQLVNPSCPPPQPWFLGSFDLPDTRSVFPVLNPEREAAGTPGYAEIGTPVPGDHVDQLGRPAALYRLVSDGGSGPSEAEMVAIHSEVEWYVDPATGDVLQITERGESDGNRLERTRLVTSDEAVALDPTLFATAGYSLLYDAAAPDPVTDRFTAEPIEPAIELGRDNVIWPPEPEPGGASALGRRFGTELLGWEDPQVTEDGTGNVRVEDGDGHAVTLFVPAVEDQKLSVMGQLGGSASTIGFGPGLRGDAQVGFHPLAGAAAVVIHTRMTDGEMRAWRTPTSPDKQYEILLPGAEPGAMGPWLAVFYDAEGQAIDAFGWGSSY